MINREPVIIINNNEVFNQWYEIYVLFSPTDDKYYIFLVTKELFSKKNTKLYSVPENQIIKLLKSIIICIRYFPSFRFNEKFLDTCLIQDLHIDHCSLKSFGFNFKEERLY